jgi:hypothetical protein
MGRNDSGQLGLDYPVGDATYTLKPRLIASGVVAAAAGEEYSLFLTGDQTLYGVGCVPQATSCSSVRKSVANGVSAVAAGSDHALFLRKGGGFLFAFGNNDKGQLGDGTTTNRSLTTPVAVIDETGTYQSGVAAVVAGRKNTLFKKANGTLWGMGDNGFGQLGQGNTTNQTKPKPILYNANQLTVATLGTLRFDQDWFDNLSCSASPDSSPQEKIAMRQGERAASSCQTWPEAHALVVAASGSSSNGGLQSVGPKPPPVIVIAGGDFQQSLQRIIIIDASGSTSSTGGPLTYQWSSSDPVWISGNTTAAPTVGLGYSRRLNTLQLTVTDSTGNSSTQQIQIEYLGPLQ